MYFKRHVYNNMRLICAMFKQPEAETFVLLISLENRNFCSPTGKYKCISRQVKEKNEFCQTFRITVFLQPNGVYLLYPKL